MSNIAELAEDAAEEISSRSGRTISSKTVEQIITECLMKFENQELYRLQRELESTQDALRREIRKGMRGMVTA